jgi:APA family basic amino acid/polyamine antiporter
VRHDGEAYEVPIVGIIGFFGIASVLLMVILTHPIGRIAGPVWIAVGLVGYYVYRRKHHLPVYGTTGNWSAEQLKVYEESGEYALAEEYRTALRRHARYESNKIH